MGTSPTVNRIKRFAIIKEVYAATGANPAKVCNAFEIGRELAYDRDDIIGLVEYLHANGLIVQLDPIMINTGDPRHPDERGLVKLTAKGIDEFEKVVSGKESEYFPSYSLIQEYPELINKKSSPAVKETETVSAQNKEMIEAVSKQPRKEWDVFISHATEDKESFARPLYGALRKHNLNVWYDESELSWGKKLSSAIDEGLSNSAFGIIVLSKNFFKKEWTQAELGGLYTRMIGTKRNNILPILHGLSQQDLLQYAPLLADIVNRSSEVGVDQLAQEIYEIVTKTKTQRSTTPSTPSPQVSFADANSTQPQFDAERRGLEQGNQSRPAILNKIENRLYWRVILRPVTYSPNQLTLQRCKEVVATSTIRLRGWDYPFHNASAVQHGLNYVQEAVDFRSHIALWRMYQSGQFVHIFAGIEDGEPTVPEKSLLVLATLYAFTEIYEFAKNLADKSVFGDSVSITIELHNVGGRSLTMLDIDRELYHDYRSIENELPIRKIVSKNELTENSHELALADTVWVFERFGWTADHVPEMLRQYQKKFLKGLI